MIIINPTYLPLQNYQFIDLFAGIGAFHLALSCYGAKCVFASELDIFAQEIYLQNFGIKPAGDLTKIVSENIPKHEILCAGFPCQAFSICGKQKGFEDTRGTLFFEILRIAKYHQPQILILENVKNLLIHNNCQTLKVILSSLNEIGYHVFYEVLNASNFGLPQARERLFFVGFHQSLNINKFSFPLPTYNSVTLKDICLDDSQTKHYIINRNDVKIKPIKIIPDLFGKYPLKPIRIGHINNGGQGERIYHELGHSITLSAYGGGIGAKTGLYLINNKIRKLAPRECARLQGFPDSFMIHSHSNQAYKQFGNSIPVNVLQLIVKEIINHLIFNKI